MDGTLARAMPHGGRSEVAQDADVDSREASQSQTADNARAEFPNIMLARQPERDREITPFVR